MNTHFFRNKRVVVTGGTGMIGRQIVYMLADLKGEIDLVSTSLEAKPPAWPCSHWSANLIRCSGSDLDDLLEGTDVLIHAAGIKAGAKATVENGAHFLGMMTELSLRPLVAARAREVKNVIFVSSIGAYAQTREERPILEQYEHDQYASTPMDLPGWGKRIAEMYVKEVAKETGWNWSCVRPSNVYGPGDNFNPDTGMVVGALLGKVLRGDNPVMVLGDGTARRDFLYSADAARGILTVVSADYRLGNYYNLGGELPYSISDLTGIIRWATGATFEFSGGAPTYPYRVLDSWRACALGWERKADLYTGILAAYDWARKNVDVARFDPFSKSS